MARLPPDLAAEAEQAREPRELGRLSRQDKVTEAQLGGALRSLVGTYLRPVGEPTPESRAYDQLIDARTEEGLLKPPTVYEEGRDLFVFACERCSLVCVSNRSNARRCSACGNQSSLSGGHWNPPTPWRCVVCGRPAYAQQPKLRCSRCEQRRERERKRLGAERRRAAHGGT